MPARRKAEDDGPETIEDATAVVETMEGEASQADGEEYEDLATKTELLDLEERVMTLERKSGVVGSSNALIALEEASRGDGVLRMIYQAITGVVSGVEE